MEIPTGIGMQAQLCIYDKQGRLVTSFTPEPGKSEYTFYAPTGTYWVQISDNGELYFQKIEVVR